MAGGDHPNVDLTPPCQTDACYEASAQVDHSSVDSRQVCVGIEHRISVGEEEANMVWNQFVLLAE